MLIAGIDEAGYGPVLGPLAVARASFEAPGEVANPPCLWHLLRPAVRRAKPRGGRLLHIADSKQVHAAAGVAGLERGVLAMLAAGGDLPPSLDALLEALRVQEDLTDHPWYDAPAPFPLEHSAVSLRLTGNALRAALSAAGVAPPTLRAHVVLEGRLNRSFASTRNKAATLFNYVAMHLCDLLEACPEDGAVIVCDRQGGREHYAGLLRLMFEEWDLTVVSEADDASEYLLQRRGRAARLIFAEKGESRSLAVALASMLAKYLRESLMHRFNAWWRQRIPEIAPTAGYWTDGQRFLRDIRVKAGELGIDLARLTRQR